MKSNPARLRLFLSIDAAATMTMAVLFLFFAPWLSSALAIPVPLLRGAGGVCLAFAGALGMAASAKQPSPRLVWALVIGNALWVIDSVLLLFTPWLAPNTLGIIFVLAQAGAVAVFTVAEFTSLRDLRPSATT